MIGQNQIKSIVSNLIEQGSFPKVCVILGRSGFGKTTCVNYIIEQLKIPEVYSIESIDDARDIIYNAPSFSHNVAVHITSFENLNFRAKETLLKICEDVPKNIYIFIEVTNFGLCDDRFLNRAYTIEMTPYTVSELSDIAKTFKSDISDNELKQLFSIVGTPKNIEECISYGISEYSNFINKVINNITKAQTFNIMKLCDKLSTKNGDGLISFSLFFNSIINISFKEFKNSGNLDMLKLFECATKFLNELLLCKTVNKKMLFDNFLLELKG